MSQTDRLAEIEARTNAATPGPWYAVCITGNTWTVSDGPTYYSRDVLGGLDDAVPQCDEKEVEANAQFQAHAREDVPWLIEEVKRLRAEIEHREAVIRGACDNFNRLHERIDPESIADEIMQETDCWTTDTVQRAAEIIRQHKEPDARA